MKELTFYMALASTFGWFMTSMSITAMGGANIGLFIASIIPITLWIVHLSIKRQ